MPIQPAELAVVIPALNEARCLPRLLTHLRRHCPGLKQLIVADGGSSDGTQALAHQHHATLVHAPPGRGPQLNAGVQAVTTPHLLFLHADTLPPPEASPPEGLPPEASPPEGLTSEGLPPEASPPEGLNPEGPPPGGRSPLEAAKPGPERGTKPACRMPSVHAACIDPAALTGVHPPRPRPSPCPANDRHVCPLTLLIHQTLGKPGVVAGAFRLSIDHPARPYRWIETAVNRRSQKRQLPYGDQGLFMPTETFRQTGGFPNWPVMEDYALVRKLQPLGTIALADARVITSARGWQRRGWLKTTLLNQACIAAYNAGLSPQTIARWRN